MTVNKIHLKDCENELLSTSHLLKHLNASSNLNSEKGDKTNLHLDRRDDESFPSNTQEQIVAWRLNHLSARQRP
jgi:hypothetical protein